MKKLKIEDYSIIKPYLDLADYEGYNSNFVTMMMWNHEYHIEYEIHEHFLVMLHYFKNTYFWAMPFTTPEYYKEAVEYMIDYSQKHHFDFVIECANSEFVSRIKDIYHNKFLYERTSYNDDYIYDRDMLQNLSGKKMQKRRNHYNAFLKENPHYVYRDLHAQKDFDTILECLNRWETDKDNMSESMTSEIFGIMYLLSSKHLLDFEVGGIFIDDVMQAFIIASKLPHDTVQIHVEKANKNIRGLYPAILKEMLEHHFEGALYINREEDMGLENLRKSKKALHPCKMIEKYRLTLRQTCVLKATIDDKEQIIQLWKDSFQDENELTTKFYFENLYQEENTYVLKQNSKIISALQIVPMDIKRENEIKTCYFLLGVCTNENFQRQGCMKELLDEVLKIYHKQIIYLQAYNPDIYRPFGFYVSHYHQKIVLDKNSLVDMELIQSYDLSLLKGYYEAFTKNYDEYRIRDENYWKDYIKRCQSFEDHICIMKDKGYFVYHEDDETIYIYECIYKDNDSLIQMLNYFYKTDKKIIIECDMKAKISGEKENIITMMSNQNHKDILNLDAYINEIY